MDDLIKRSDAIKAIKQWLDNDGSLFDVGLNQAIREIKRLPSANRPQGEWIIHFDDIWPEESTQECSVCHEHQLINGNDDYFCPNCGARMKGAGDE